jgi:hypothetical protein
LQEQHKDVVLDDIVEPVNWFCISTTASSAYTIRTWMNKVENATAVVNAAKIVRGMEMRSKMGDARKAIKLAMMGR